MKEVIKGYKFRIYPTEEQKIMIDRTCSACNYVYNGMLALRQFRYKEFGQKLSKFDLGKMLTQIKQADDWLKQFDSKALAKSIDDMDKAYDAFFKKELSSQDSKAKEILNRATLLDKLE